MKSFLFNFYFKIFILGCLAPPLMAQEGAETPPAAPDICLSKVDEEGQVKAWATFLTELAKRKRRHLYHFTECDCPQFPREGRNKFIAHLVDTIREKHQTGDTITLTSFASGKLGLEFKLLNALLEKGYRKFLIIGIDTDYGYQRPLSPTVDKFREYIESWNQNPGFEINMMTFNSLRTYKEIVDEGEFPKSDLIIDIDSGDFFEKNKAIPLLKEEGLIKSLNYHWIHSQNEGGEDLAGQGNSLSTIDSKGKEITELFHVIQKPKVVPASRQ